MNKTTARLGAAAFVLGLSLAGSPGVAAAEDGSDENTRTAAADRGESRQRPAGPPRRGAQADTRVKVEPAAGAAGLEIDTPVDVAISTVESPQSGLQRAGSPGTEPATERSDSDPPARVEHPAVAPAPPEQAPARIPPHDALGFDAPGFAGASAAVAPAAATPSTGPTAATAAASPTAPAAAVQTCGGCVASAPQARVPVAGQAITATVRAARVLDDIGNWLHSLPASPVNDLLSGALLLVRRTLFPTVPTVPAAFVGDVLVDERAGQAVFTVKLNRAYTSAVTVGYATDSSLTNPGAEPAEVAARAEPGVDYLAASGILTFAPGETSRQVVVAVLDDGIAEVTETFSLNLFATWLHKPSPAALGGVAATASHQLTGVRLASATAIIIDDDRVRIDVNPNFAYGDALWASMFADLAYNHRDAADFTGRVQAIGWEGIGIAQADLGSNGYSPAAGGYGVRDGLAMQSYAFAGKRTAADGTEQFVMAFEGSNLPWEEPADWVLNAGRYGWSQYYSSLKPLMAAVVEQMLDAQRAGRTAQLIITGHSLGGAAAMMAFADLLAPEGDLWPGTADVLAGGQRLLDAVGGWSPEVRTALLAATTVYTFGAPSILIEPNKLTTADAVAFATTAAASGLLGTLALLPRAIGVLTVDDRKLPDLTGIAGITFGTRVFQFEHANTDWLPPRTGDIVAQIGSRDPGTVLAVNLANDVQDAYTGGWALSLIPGTTHPMAGYRESVIRLVSNSRLLKSPNKLAGDSPQFPQTSPGNGSDTRNDFFVNASESGGDGNDLFVFSRPGSYVADGGRGSDLYSISSYDVALLIDGAAQSGRDTVVFDIVGVPGATYISSASGTANTTAVFSVTGAAGESSSVTVTNWDQWQVSDIMQVIRPSQGRWNLDVWTDIERGPVLAVSPANEIPLSVL